MKAAYGSCCRAVAAAVLNGISQRTPYIGTAIVGRWRAHPEIVGVMLTVAKAHHDAPYPHLSQRTLEKDGMPHVRLAAVRIEIDHVALTEVGDEGVRAVGNGKRKFVIPPTLVRAFHVVKRQTAEYVACLNLLL